MCSHGAFEISSVEGTGFGGWRCRRLPCSPTVMFINMQNVRVVYQYRATDHFDPGVPSGDREHRSVRVREDEVPLQECPFSSGIEHNDGDTRHHHCTPLSSVSRNGDSRHVVGAYSSRCGRGVFSLSSAAVFLQNSRRSHGVRGYRRCGARNHIYTDNTADVRPGSHNDGDFHLRVDMERFRKPIHLHSISGASEYLRGPPALPRAAGGKYQCATCGGYTGNYPHSDTVCCYTAGVRGKLEFQWPEGLRLLEEELV